MKTLRYLLITFAVMMVISVSAQSLAQEPSVQFQSTSSLVGSGSTLPQAAQSGVYTTYDIGSPSRMGKPGIRRVGEDDEFEDEGDDTELPGQPYPIGDGLWVLLALAAGYAVFAAWRKRVKQLNR